MPNDHSQKSYPTPKPNLMRRLMNIGAMSEADTKENPELASAWAGREIEMPAEAAATKSVRPMNWLERNTIGKEAAGLTWPWGTIAINQDVAKANKLPLGEVLAHELVHVGQSNSLPHLFKNAIKTATSSYEDQPRELEAFTQTAQRKVRQRDIDLDKPIRKSYTGK